jgi:hypothetical protein
MSSSAFSVTLGTNGPGLTVSVMLDHHVLYRGDPAGSTVTVCHDIEDTDLSEHRLVIELADKMEAHCEVNEHGDIVKDTVVALHSIIFDDVDITDVMRRISRYQHDFNGTDQPTEQPLMGTMGCNGTVTFDFTSPVYLWILENM